MILLLPPLSLPFHSFSLESRQLNISFPFPAFLPDPDALCPQASPQPLLPLLPLPRRRCLRPSSSSSFSPLVSSRVAPHCWLTAAGAGGQPRRPRIAARRRARALAVAATAHCAVAACVAAPRRCLLPPFRACCCAPRNPSAAAEQGGGGSRPAANGALRRSAARVGPVGSRGRGCPFPTDTAAAWSRST